MCPPGVDQTTRSPPQWNLLAPKLEQRQTLPEPEESRIYGYGPWEFLRAGETWDAFEKLARIPSSVYETPESLLPSRIKPRSPAVASALEILPAEILQMVVAELDMSDKVAMALCSQNLWCYILGGLQVQYGTGIAPWAGTPIICTGTWLQCLPDSIFNLFPDLENEYENWSRSPGRAMSPARRWNWSTYDYSDVGEIDKLKSQYRQALSKHTESLGITRQFRQELDQKLERAFLSTRNLTGAWVLRNLNTREVVHLKLTQRKRMGDPWVAVKGLPWLTIDIALILRICWLSYERTSERTGAEYDLHIGAWAGHCFDVVETSTLGCDKGWKDVTGDIITTAKSLKVGDR